MRRRKNICREKGLLVLGMDKIMIMWVVIVEELFGFTKDPICCMYEWLFRAYKL